MEQKTEEVFPMTKIKRPPDPYAPGSYAPEPQGKKSHFKGPQASKAYAPEPQAPRSYAPKSYAPDPCAPKTYSTATPPYGPSPGYSAPYAPKASSSNPFAPSYGTDARPSPSYTSEPFPLEPSAPEHIEFTDDGCSYTIEVMSGDCPEQPPPYTAVEIHCDKIATSCCNPVNQPPVVVAGIFSSKPASTICPCCRQIITTEVTFRVGTLNYAVCSCLCVVGCCLGCCLVPFFCKCCKDVDHYCPCCGYHIYRYKRI
ncbi:lipopolysaccharide-induced tumor necrosis factor-alpha factor homolog [Paroedura picta]|uniref:lipopolysaccharide-induced tumor necrosis factor-alpha factor homolog n=1 Tax=Paroedura picta TaxID=143630 RepID=UPI0040572AB9